MAKDESPRITELDDWVVLISRPEWKHWIKIQKQHQEYLQKKINEAVGSHDLMSAFASLIAMRDVQRQIDLVQEKLNELKKGE
jgi:hypothetical protein